MMDDVGDAGVLGGVLFLIVICHCHYKNSPPIFMP